MPLWALYWAIGALLSATVAQLVGRMLDGRTQRLEDRTQRNEDDLKALRELIDVINRRRSSEEEKWQLHIGTMAEQYRAVTDRLGRLEERETMRKETHS